MAQPEPTKPVLTDPGQPTAQLLNMHPHRPMQHQPLAPEYVPFLPVGLVLAFEERKIKLSAEWIKLPAG